MHVEGELFIQQITAPMELHTTETVEIETFNTEPALSSNPTTHTHAINIPAHSHVFRAPAMTLVGGNAALRAAAANALNSSSSRNVASKIHNEKKG